MEDTGEPAQQMMHGIKPTTSLMPATAMPGGMVNFAPYALLLLLASVLFPAAQALPGCPDEGAETCAEYALGSVVAAAENEFEQLRQGCIYGDGQACQLSMNPAVNARPVIADAEASVGATMAIVDSVGPLQNATPTFRSAANLAWFGLGLAADSVDFAYQAEVKRNEGLIGFVLNVTEAGISGANPSDPAWLGNQVPGDLAPNLTLVDQITTQITTAPQMLVDKGMSAAGKAMELAGEGAADVNQTANYAMNSTTNLLDWGEFMAQQAHDLAWATAKQTQTTVEMWAKSVSDSAWFAVGFVLSLIDVIDSLYEIETEKTPMEMVLMAKDAVVNFTDPSSPYTSSDPPAGAPTRVESQEYRVTDVADLFCTAGGQHGGCFDVLQTDNVLFAALQDATGTPVVGRYYFFDATNYFVGEGIFCGSQTIVIPPGSVSLEVQAGLPVGVGATVNCPGAATTGVVTVAFYDS